QLRQQIPREQDDQRTEERRHIVRDLQKAVLKPCPEIHGQKATGDGLHRAVCSVRGSGTIPIPWPPIPQPPIRPPPLPPRNPAPRARHPPRARTAPG